MQELTRLWGQAVVARRNELELSQKALADLAGTTQQHLSLIERGAVEPRADLKTRLASAPNTTVPALFIDQVPA